MLKIDNLNKSYGTFRLDCSMEVLQGRVTGLVGQNGAGKSTTFKAVLGLIRPDGGRIEILGKDSSQFSAKEKQELGVVLSNAGFSGYLTIKDIVPVMGSLYARFDKTFFLEQVRRFGLPDNQKIKEFSTGMKAKLKVLTAISHRARLLILDEPTAGLDVVARDELLELLRAFMEQDEDRGILVSSHISGDLETLCDDIYMLHNGKIILHEDTDVLLDDYAVLKVDEQQYRTIEKRYILRCRKESFGYSCLTNQKRFYMENYPKLAVLKGSIDEVIMMMIRGEAL
ncbi:MAG: ABC transporter ATP-binding protein [Lachnospiraceae bacterium]|jgi:ABC-2 type transport system ATP-binding protein|nr:ABC transporter ATP-binding protein [uncultured Acetatifactor sp.]MCI9221077.1 ABC transporter ATP-binding protein [Lachnospiraceae bacterium]